MLQEELDEKKRAKIMQFFIEDKHKQRSMRTAMARGKDTVFQLKQQLNSNPNQYECVLWYKDVELEDGKQIYTYNIPDNSELTMELRAIPGSNDDIPCDRCGQSFPIEIYMIHNEECGRSKNVNSNSTKPKPAEDDPLIPCENCAQYIPFSSFMNHASTCQ